MVGRIHCARIASERSGLSGHREMSGTSARTRRRIPWPNPSARPRAGQNEDRVLPEAENVDHAQLANAIRALSMDAVQAANSGHPGMPMGAADIATVLFTRYLKYLSLIHI